MCCPEFQSDVPSSAILDVVHDKRLKDFTEDKEDHVRLYLTI